MLATGAKDGGLWIRDARTGKQQGMMRVENRILRVPGWVPQNLPWPALPA